jgi:hypothetical protein
MRETPVTPVRDYSHGNLAIQPEICFQDGFTATAMKFFFHVKTFSLPW